MVVFPEAMPLTNPVVLTEPTDGVTLLHTPPAAPSVSVVLTPAQTTGVPVIVPAFGNALTVTTRVAAAVPQPLATV